MDPFKRAEIGNTGLHVTRLGLGARGIVDPAVDVSDAQAVATVERALGDGINYIDTSPRYGLGKSESFVGQIVSGIDRSSFILSTKVGRRLAPTVTGGWFWDFSREGARRSLESSLDRLGIDAVDILFIHSPNNHYDQAISETYRELVEMRSAGMVKAIGVGMTNGQMLLRFAREGDFDCFLLAGRYTLLDQSAAREFLPYCEQHEIGVILGGPYNSGILASDLGPGALYDYRAAPAEIMAQARRIKTVCDRHSAPLKAAALQFVLAHPAITSVIPGSSYPEHVQENISMIERHIPPDLWKELCQEGLIPEDAPLPH
jgi:D-threo-aldose 1-dehydrogenase